MIPPYLAVLRYKAQQKKCRLHVEANSPRQAATMAAEHWLRDGADLASGASIQVHRYQPDGRLDPSVRFRLATRALERMQQKAITRRDELRKWRHSLQASRRAAIQRMEQHLASGQIAKADLNTLKAEFEAAAERNRGPEAFLSLEGLPLLRGSGTLKSRGLANRAALGVNRLLSDGAWKVWLEILLGFLLQNDELGEFVEKSVITSRSLGRELRIFEAYSIKRMPEASALCCSWLTTTAASEVLPELVAKLGNSSAAEAGLAADSTLDAAANLQQGSDDSPRVIVPRSVRRHSKALEILRNAMEGQGLNPPALARKIAKRLTKRRRTAKFDRSTMYRILNGQTMKPHSLILHGIIAVLELDWESEEIVRREFGTFRPERSPKSPLASRN